MLELTATEGTVETLSLLLVDNGMMVQQSAMDGEHINLVLSDQRLGRAQWDSAGQRWLVLLVAALCRPDGSRCTAVERHGLFDIGRRVGVGC